MLWCRLTRGTKSSIFLVCLCPSVIFIFHFRVCLTTVVFFRFGGVFDVCFFFLVVFLVFELFYFWLFLLFLSFSKFCQAQRRCRGCENLFAHLICSSFFSSLSTNSYCSCEFIVFRKIAFLSKPSSSVQIRRTSASLHIYKNMRRVSEHFPFSQAVGVLRSLLTASLFEHPSMGQARNPPTQRTTLRGCVAEVQRVCRFVGQSAPYPSSGAVHANNTGYKLWR